MKVFHGRQGAASEAKTETFTGQVFGDPVMPTTDGVTINNVFFAPGARTFWHTHEVGQILTILAGQGWICVEGEAASPLRAGDTVWIPQGEKHWHGAAADSYLLHTAISIGKTHWLQEVDGLAYEEASAPR
ncbi:MAG: cupin domain-containing protein [Alphaproteobacteria bacterium]|jgi:quercetin dioxygenase-like cupin family protein|nr:cupin domain-containing protein [Alphaproteobacteria bacterium]MBU1548552.1 cupin domain-containing protein [Alphaproteobacteria bacterium]MBU2337748.1 cupin domain-containing protein [Alphaproteobacteria bacterium]MBU2389885.1 cupin domain-containing protein [Alphaproteobacteria bacterium]